MQKRNELIRAISLVVSLAWAPACIGADPTLYTALTGATVIDSGIFVVAEGPNAREEPFEYIRRPDGGFTLVNTITSTDGSYRVNGRFDFDSAWNAMRVHGNGLYKGKPVSITLESKNKGVEITVAEDGKSSTFQASCDTPCLMDMAPSATPMFAMTRHYDFSRGGEQLFLWAAQDLIRPFSVLDDQVKMKLIDEKNVELRSGTTVKLRHFYFLESIKLPSGPPFTLSFDIWTDLDHRPMAFRVRAPTSTAIGTIGLRKGFGELGSLITN